MMKFLSPLKVTIIGFVLLLLSTIFYPAIASAVTSTRADIAARGIDTNNYWMLDVVLTAARGILFFTGIGCIVYSALREWIWRKG